MRLWVFVVDAVELFGSIAGTYDTDEKTHEERHSGSDEDSVSAYHSVVNIFTLNFTSVLFLVWSRKHLDSVGGGEHDVVVADALFLELSKQAIVVLRHR